MERLTAPAEFKNIQDTGTFTGYASIYGNVDLGGDIVERGAFEEIVKTKDGQVRILYQHKTADPIGKALVKSDDTGLYFEGQLVLEDPLARKAYAHLKAATLDGMSIGYDVLANGEEYTNGGLRKLKRLKLWEISLVTFGMNPQAKVENVKRAHEVRTVREFEEFLRDAGFSAAAARGIASAGFKASEAYLRDAGADVASVAEAVRDIKLFGDPQRDAGVDVRRVLSTLREVRLT